MSARDDRPKEPRAAQGTPKPKRAREPRAATEPGTRFPREPAPADAPRADEKAARRSPEDASTGTRHALLSAGIGLFAAALVAVLVNVLSARHYRRWDLTSASLYSLSPLTVQTLHTLEEPVSLYVLLPSGNALTLSVRQLLEAYRAESSRLDVQYIDPDNDAAAFIALQNRFNIAAAAGPRGQVVADAAIVVARGERHHFIAVSDLVEIENAEEGRMRPRLEEALTGGLRMVLRGEKRSVCFTQGHGELTLEAGGGLVALKQWLEKNNFESLGLPGVRELREKDPLPSCQLLVVAGPAEPFPPEEQERVLRYVDKGGSVLAAVEAVPDARKETLRRTGLDALFARAGLRHQVDFVIELDRALQRGGLGETFAAKPLPHDINHGLLTASGIEVVINTATSFVPSDSGVAPIALLETSEDALGVVDFAGVGPNGVEKRAADHQGPLDIAFASELPAKNDGSAARGARIVIIGSRRALATANWEIPGLRGTAAFVQGAVEWLAFQPVVLDIPPKPAQASGLKMGPDMLRSVLYWTVLFIPGGTALIGIAIAVRRRMTEGRRRARGEKERAARAGRVAQRRAERGDDGDDDRGARS